MDVDNHSSEISIQQAIASIRNFGKGVDVMRLPVFGNSMIPVLKDRDILIVGLIPPRKLRCGDIIVWGKHELITHRVLFSRHDRIYTKGDARYWIDPQKDHKDILGIVKQIDRNGLIVDMESMRWKIINRMIGSVGWIQLNLTWKEQLSIKSRERKRWIHRISYKLSKSLNWFILFILARKWLIQKPLRMDEKC